MEIVATIFLNVIIYIVLYIVTRIILDLKISMKDIGRKIENTKYGKSLNEVILEFDEKELSKTKLVTHSSILFMGLTVGVIVFIVIKIIFKSLGMGIVLGVATFFLPKIIVKLTIQTEKHKLITTTVPYLINLKNHIAQDNNILSAIQTTERDKPLDKYISHFLAKIEMGVNAIEAMESLKKEINISEWDQIIISLESCYKNGGKFEQVIDYQIECISKKIILKEKEKEEAYSSVITLVLMIAMSAVLTVKYCLGGGVTAKIMTTTFIGKTILTLSAIGYVVTAFFISRIYKMEE